MARPRKVVSLSTGKISKEEREIRERQEGELKLARTGLVAPSWLSEFAQLEFYRVVEETAQIEILDNLDLSVLAIYCNAYDSYIQVSEQLKKEGHIIERVNRYETYKTQNPLVATQNTYVSQIMSCSQKLGLATTDRLKLIVPVKESKDTNKYLKYVK